MCINVQLPVVTHFLLLYSLRSGSICILVWTTIRSFACLFFFVIAMLETIVKRPSPFGAMFVHTSKTITEGSLLFVYYSFVGMIVMEAILFYHSIYLMFGIYYTSSKPLQAYLPCRFLTWIFEVIFLFTLCLTHKLLIGWYLIILMFVILEFYGFVIIYSYYRELMDCEAVEYCKEEDDPGINFCKSLE